MSKRKRDQAFDSMLQNWVRIYAIAVAVVFLILSMYSPDSEARNKRFVDTIPKSYFVGKFAPPWLEWYCFEANDKERARAYRLLTSNTRIKVEVTCPAQRNPDRS